MKKISCYKGRYHRSIGKAVNSAGTLSAKKFHLGTDEAGARRIAERLELLWAEVVNRHKRSIADAARYDLVYHGVFNRITGECKPGEINTDEATWDEESLLVAEAICKEQPSINVAPQTQRQAEPATVYLERVASLQTDYKLVAFIPDLATYNQAQQQVSTEVDALGEQAASLVELTGSQITWAPGGMLHEAMDAYIEWLRSKYTRKGELTKNGAKLISAMGRLKAAATDMPLDRLKHDAMESMAGYWYQRPDSKRADGKSSGKPISIETVKNMIKLLRRFLLWLNSTDQYQWQVAEHVIKTATNGHRLQDIQTETEKKAAADGPDTWTRDELITLYRHATDRERLYILLGLNAGFAQSELEHLDRNEVDLDGEPPILDYMRHKTSRKGGAKLWPETVAAIHWAYAEQATAGHGNGRALLKANGEQLDEQAISNSWNRLLDRVQKAEPGFRRLSFKYLRKTAAQLLQDEGDASSETIAIMEARAKWTGHDEQADRYYKRRLDGVYSANDRVREHLEPMVNEAPEAFSKARKKGGSNIGADVIESIRREYAECGNKTEVSRRLGVSRQTVHRHLS